ncbi:hypothetical protein E0K89_002770 [Aquicoccus sp. SCR17]|nr:hypothetical protein [Carideicomes alvinocaridis]
MTRATGFLLGWAALATALLAPLLWVEAHGFLSGAVIADWGRAILQVDGPALFRATDPLYPPLPKVLTLAVQGVAGRPGLPTPHIVSLAVGGLTLLVWFGEFRRRGRYSAPVAAALVLLLALNPVFLRALSEGPGAVFLVLGTWLYARSLLDLRQSGTAPDMMKVAIGLLVVSMAHPFGLLIAMGSLPVIVLAARPSMIAASSLGFMVSMFFPAAAAVASLLFVSLVLGSTFLALEPTPAGLAPLDELSLPLLTGAMAVIVLARLVPAPRRMLPLLAAMAGLLGAILLNFVFRFESDPALLAAPMLGLLAAALPLSPVNRVRGAAMTAFLLLALPLNGWGLATFGAELDRRWLEAALGHDLGDPLRRERALAAFLRDREGVLLDAERHPGLIAVLGGTRGLVIAGQTSYELAALGGRPRAGYIAVRAPEGSTGGRDRLLAAQPQLSISAPGGYRLAYQSGPWRVFEITGGNRTWDGT